MWNKRVVFYVKSTGILFDISNFPQTLLAQSIHIQLRIQNTTLVAVVAQEIWTCLKELQKCEVLEEGVLCFQLSVFLSFDIYNFQQTPIDIFANYPWQSFQGLFQCNKYENHLRMREKRITKKWESPKKWELQNKVIHPEKEIDKEKS